MVVPLIPGSCTPYLSEIYLPLLWNEAKLHWGIEIWLSTEWHSTSEIKIRTPGWITTRIFFIIKKLKFPMTSKMCNTHLQNWRFFMSHFSNVLRNFSEKSELVKIRPSLNKCLWTTMQGKDANTIRRRCNGPLNAHSVTETVTLLKLYFLKLNIQSTCVSELLIGDNPTILRALFEWCGRSVTCCGHSVLERRFRNWICVHSISFFYLKPLSKMTSYKMDCLENIDND